MQTLYPAIATLAAYLIGSLSFAVIVSRAMGLHDPRSYGSGNPGATNVLRSGNKAAAVLTLVLDALKGFVPVVLVMRFGAPIGLDEGTVALVGLAAFVGHLWPVFFHFKGGKGVATAAGVLLGLNPWLGLATLATWVIIAAFTRYSSLAALVAAVFAPFYQVQHRVYAAYWDFYTPAAWEKHTTELSAERERVRRLDAATIDVVAPGAAQAEREHNQQGENTSITRVDGRPGRTGRGWFSYEMPVDPHGATVLVATYETDARRERTFDILVDGQRIAQPSFERTSVSTFVDAEYPIPADLVRGKSKVTVRFEATNGNDIAAVFALRTIRATVK